jgi:hypothetical protein
MTSVFPVSSGAPIVLLLGLAAVLASCESAETTPAATTSGGGGGAAGSAPEACSQEGAVADCYPGSPATRGIGTCESGTQTCEGGTWGECTGYTLPVDEDCHDGLDNDCNGAADDGCPCNAGEAKPCYTGPAPTRTIGECTDGMQSCVGGTWDTLCAGQTLPGTEACDDLDNDCNGVTDDDCWCGNGLCAQDEDCNSCPQDCPPGGLKDCYGNGLHSNCCSGPNSNTTECLACNNEVGCPPEEYAAYCDRFNAGDNLWQQYHRGWVESQCGAAAQSDGSYWSCTNASTCTTYRCAL